ncbi:hypothetical protein L249_7718 [Ophiocordyceps polyrhachis-furcata BCC 54312]|uniref:Uncharacterized protein n=1 Tax=Ophiocordyceps polyrhachis-furcata BCC 54312 TaxID=1330021 RepID=A0A367LAS8_9HYPO|nr:hypothetical protein L249_7718 [Ophiocordyceps polyrhachis-furcata BCC 54312]
MAEDDDDGDDVYPLHAFDDTQYNRKLLSWLMRFNDVLDPGRLHGALARLLDIGDWRKLGGRLKLKPSGKLEVHAPKHFSPDRPAVSFTHQDFSGLPIEEHPIARRFPEPTDGPSIQPISDFRPFLAPRDYPKTLQDMISRDLPQLSLHITSFRNATLVAIAWPHTLMDAIGQQALLRSWSLVLAGREQDVPPILGAREDFLKELEDDESEEEREPLALERNRLGMLGSFAMIARFVWDRFWSPPLELRAIYLPGKTLSRLRAQAQKQIGELPENPGHDDRFVSEGDVLTAWIARAVSLPRRPLTLVSFFNPRYRLPRLRDETTGVYAQNMTQLSFTFCSPHLAGGDLGHLALQHRRQMAEQTSGRQTLSLMRTMRRGIEAGKFDVFFGEANALPIFYNNLTRVDLLKAVDFGPAVLSRGDSKPKNPPGTMVMYYNQPVDGSLRGPSSFYMLGKDYADNHWLMGDLLPQAWTRIEDELRALEDGG